VTSQTVVSIEKGKNNPSLPLAFCIANLFNVKIEDVFLNKSEPGELWLSTHV
jgi:putative transcriptional regulator